MKKILLIFLTLVSFAGFSQTYDVVIKKPNYTSYFENDFRNPTVVVYNLYHGGGDCKRDKFYFKNDEPKVVTATDAEYLKSGFDKGHMANAEDFAYDCTLDELTFRYYNCVPQYPRMNRGPWKKIETSVREMSQKQSLKIVCVNIYSDKFIPNTKIGVPTVCLKFVYDSKTNKPIIAYWVTNENNHTSGSGTVQEIEKKYKLKLNQFLN
jgi:endonuclease G